MTFTHSSHYLHPAEDAARVATFWNSPVRPTLSLTLVCMPVLGGSGSLPTWYAVSRACSRASSPGSSPRTCFPLWSSLVTRQRCPSCLFLFFGLAVACTRSIACALHHVFACSGPGSCACYSALLNLMLARLHSSLSRRYGLQDSQDIGITMASTFLAFHESHQRFASSFISLPHNLVRGSEIIILELTMRMGQGPFHFRSQEQNLMLHCAQLDSQLILFSPALEASRTRMFIVDHHAQKTRYTFSAKNALLAFRSYASPPEPRGNRGGT